MERMPLKREGGKEKIAEKLMRQLGKGSCESRQVSPCPGTRLSYPSLHTICVLEN